MTYIFTWNIIKMSNEGGRNMKLVELQTFMTPEQKIDLYDKGGNSLGVGYIKEIGNLPYANDDVYVIVSGSESRIDVFLDKVVKR